MSEFLDGPFTAIDFETATERRDSACALGLVRVENGAITARWSRLVRPPERDFVFTYIHGIRWKDVERAPTFRELWPEIAGFIADSRYLVAHNAPFDRGVLNATCARFEIEPPAIPFVCTVKLARRAFAIYPTTLPDCCRTLGIALNHHDAASDAEAAARIVMAAAALDQQAFRSWGEASVTPTRNRTTRNGWKRESS